MSPPSDRRSLARWCAAGGGAILPALALALLTAPALAAKAPGEPCADGTFAVAGPALARADGTPSGGVVALADSTVAIVGLCDTPAAATVRAGRKATVVRARWTTCGGLPGPVRLRAKIRAGDCATMRGRLRARKAKPRSQRFTAVRRPLFESPTLCASCHPRQYQEWQRSMMAYGAISPVFNALEAVGNQLLDGAFAADGTDPLFCQGCHAPVSVALGEFPGFAGMEGRPSREFTGEVGGHGLSCDFCHQVSHADLEKSPRGDGIANSAFVLQPGAVKMGPFDDPLPNTTHGSTASQYLRSAEFCGSCHDVRLPGTDAVTGEPLRRLEDAFSEWQRSPYATAANPYGRIVTCQDCHMSAYPYAPPGTYPTDEAAIAYGVPLRPVSTHYFTGVDVALIDFPGQDDQGVDTHGLPAGQARRRVDLLRAACTLALEVPSDVRAGDVLPVTVAVTNTGAGHHVPAGFSQEREMWVELRVTDAADALVYESGYLVDRAHPETGEAMPDGRLEDEDLEAWIGTIDPVTLEATGEAGPDHNRRPEEQLGLVSFRNELLRVGPGGAHEVFVPFLANAMDNTRSIPPLETARARYDVPLPDGVRGPVRVSARLRFRAFPPRFLRMLAQARPDLVDEAVVDRNRVVDMAETERAVEVID